HIGGIDVDVAVDVGRVDAGGIDAGAPVHAGGVDAGAPVHAGAADAGTGCSAGGVGQRFAGRHEHERRHCRNDEPAAGTVGAHVHVGPLHLVAAGVWPAKTILWAS